MYTLSLEIINKCNLNCKYCYLGEKKNTYMSTDIARKSIEIAIHEALKQYDKTLLIYFIGGEPLMAFDILKEITNYANKRCSETGLKSMFSTTINGTLLTDEITDFFIKHKFDLKLSLDGPESVHDLNRIDYAGKGSFKRIMENLPQLRRYEECTQKKVSYAQVITKNNYKRWGDCFKFLLDLGCEKIESGVDHYCAWDDQEINCLQTQFTKVFYIYKEYIQKEKKTIFWNLFDLKLQSFLLPCDFYACKAGLNSIYIAVNGNIYTCMELERFKIGSVETGLDVPRIREIAYIEDKVNVMCEECSYLKNCKTRGCQVSNYEVYQDVYQPVKVNCIITKTVYDLIEKNVSKEQLAKIREELLRRRNHGKK